MAGDKKNNNNNNKGGKHRKQYLPQNRAVKKKGQYPLTAGVQGFFITCDGGREFQASQEAINVIDSFFEELVYGKDGDKKPATLPNKPPNKKITFSYSDDDADADDRDNEVVGVDEVEAEEKKDQVEKDQETKSVPLGDDKCSGEIPIDNKLNEAQEEKTGDDDNTNGEIKENPATEAVEPPAKKQCIETTVSKVEEKSIDKLIEDELKELGDKTKRRFSKLDSGCNGVVFVQMRKRDGDPGPKDIAQFMMTSAASTKKHMSRFILRVLPVEVSCYASEEEVSRAIKPLIEQNFPTETENPHKFAVLCEARSNTGLDKAKIINVVAKSVPAPHKVDLTNPDKTIIVQIVKTVCLIGIVEKYKELAKFNLRQLTSPKD
ncbi:hypothetical protein ACFE04_004885 [Oxalis oulophora]